jgi:ribonucleoside-diphosphate reductase alpha chain
MGYINEGMTAEQRVREIADAAEKILKIEGFADKFYDYMGKGYYSL